MKNRINMHKCPGGALSEKEREYLESVAYDIRVNVIRLVSMCNWGHIGGSLSMGEMLAVLFGGAANLTKQNVANKKRDYIVLSKAHCSPAYYSAMLRFGFFEEETFFKYGLIGGLEGHLLKDNPIGVDCSAGSLGLGLSYCVGLAKAMKLKEHYSERVYCICGDGEMNEGQIWEAAMSAAQFKLDNLILLVDYNKVMAKGYVYDIMEIEPLATKLAAFGFFVQECDGHDVNAVSKAIYAAKYLSMVGKPNAIILHTSKGRGVDECEFNYQWHTHAPDLDTANRFLKKLSESYERPYNPITRIYKGKDGGLRAVLEVNQ